MKTVYLAGSINGLDYTRATQWRNQASHELTIKGYNVLDPMRGKTDLLNKGVINDSKTIYKPEHILKRDLWDIKHSDYLIANLEQLGEFPMIGTLMELGLCLNPLSINCILFNVPPQFINHPFFSTFIIKKDLKTVLKEF